MSLKRVLTAIGVLALAVHINGVAAQDVAASALRVKHPPVQEERLSWEIRKLERNLMRLDRQIGRERSILQSLESYHPVEENRRAIRQSRERLAMLMDERKADERQLRHLRRQQNRPGSYHRGSDDF